MTAEFSDAVCDTVRLGRAFCFASKAGGRFARRVSTKQGGGEGGIRTPDTVARTPHFECGAFNHSATSPWRRARSCRAGWRYVAKGG